MNAKPRRTLTALALLLALAPVLAPRAKAAPDAAVPGGIERFVFFAVLERLYDLGLPDDVVDRVLEHDPASGQIASFVYACPICMPAYDAFALYRQRPAFYGKKGDPRDFGHEANDELLRDLTAADRTLRTAAVGRLVADGMERRLALLRLTPEERGAYQLEIEKARKYAMGLLSSFRASAPAGSPYAEMKSCALCDGASQASR